MSDPQNCLHFFILGIDIDVYYMFLFLAKSHPGKPLKYLELILGRYERFNIPHTWRAGLRTLLRFVIQNLCVRREHSAALIAFSKTSLTPKKVRTLVSKYDIPISFAAARPEEKKN